MTREVLVDGRTLYVTQRQRTGTAPDSDGGVYYRDTRHLSALNTSLVDHELVTLGQDQPTSNRRTVTTASLGSTVNRVDEEQTKQTDLVCRETQLVTENEGLWGQLVVHNHATSTYSGTVRITFDADFADIFEVRGYEANGEREIQSTCTDQSVCFVYEYTANDDRAITRSTTVSFANSPTSLSAHEATFDVSIPSQGSKTVTYTASPAINRREGQSKVGNGGRHVVPSSFEAATTEEPPSGRPNTIDIPSIRTGRTDYNRIFERSRSDIAALVTDSDYGPVALAGTPWFATVFGRDSLITAYQLLHVAPELAEGTLRYLAAHQGTANDERREEAPGKMFHEFRDGELAHCGEVPHTPYYGSIDATPLWIILLAEYYRWTQSNSFVDRHGDVLDRALCWIDAERGTDPTEFLTYDISPGVGLRHKAWRDTVGAVQFPDGEVASSPIASVEVQAYVYRALRDASMLYESVLDDRVRAESLRAEANEFASSFDDAFWLPERSYYAAALAGDGRPVPTITSNVGHCLWAGIIDPDRADDVIAHFRSDALATQWGLRTMSTEAAGYSPVSYHLGSVWPHDTSMTALGLASYGYDAAVDRLAGGLLEAGTKFDNLRFPELFCGFDGKSPKAYPSSCVPQAWSAAAPYALLRATFGLDANGGRPKDSGESDLFPPETLHSIMDIWYS